MFDVKIVSGRMLDGTGRDPEKGDVGIAGERIVALGDLSAAEAREVVDATDGVVCPGFIDVHSHSDVFVLVEPAAPSKLSQGITTEVVGNCGASAAPFEGGYRMPSDWAAQVPAGRWRTVAEYRAAVDEARPAPNVALLVGHNALRAAAAGYARRALTAEERRRMAALLEQAMDEGARGLSTGLIYAPGLFADQDEIAELATVAGRYEGIYASHLRSESQHLVEAVEECLAIAASAGARAQISHLKASGRENWPLAARAIDRIREAREDGLAVCADRYPYTASYTDLDVLFPAWAAEGGHDAVLRRLRDPESRARLIEYLQDACTEEEWATITVGSTRHPRNREFRGKPLTSVARSLGVTPVGAVLHLAETDELATGAFFFRMSEESMFDILAEPYVMVGTDASIRAPTGPLSLDYPHPRAYGTFPRFLRMSLDGRTVPLSEAVRKMTSLPADHFGLRGRGRLAAGMVADVVVFDPTEVCDLATYEQPHRMSRGIEHVFVNGVHTLSGGLPTGRRAGRFI